MSESPHITFMLQYTEPNVQYVDYTNRTEAVELENELNLENQMQKMGDITEERVQEIKRSIPEQGLDFKDYVEYMNRSYATEGQNETMTAIFTQETNYLQKSRIADLKYQLQTAYENGSLLWQGVLSFDNDFLAEQGLYSKETGKVDQQALKNVIREAMPKLIEQEKLSDSAFWWGNIHLNTDHIHVHIGLSELESTREKMYYAPRRRWEYKGNFSQKTIRNLKSRVLHGLLNEETRSLHLRKEQLIANLKTELLSNVLKEKRGSFLSAEKKFLEQAYHYLPQGKKWRYGSNAKDFAMSKFYLDKYLDSYLQHEGKEMYEAFLAETKSFLKEFESSYVQEGGKEYDQIRKVNGQLVKRKRESKGYNVEKLLALREKELRRRLGDKILKSFKEDAPKFEVEEGNLEDFSKKNQRLIQEQFPEASLLHNAKQWQLKGYRILEGAVPIQVYRPSYLEYDEKGRGVGVLQFTSESYYDIRQVEKDSTRGLSLRDLHYLSKHDLVDLVNMAKQSNDLSPQSKQDLGIYRYALRLRGLEEEEISLKVVQKLLHQLNPLASDEAYLSFKQEEIKERLEFVALQLKPKYQLSEKEEEKKQAYALKYADSIRLPIKQASPETIQQALARLKEEFRLSEAVQDEQLFPLFKGSSTNKQAYQDELRNHVTIFQLKKDIYERNQEIKEADSEIKSRLKQENAKAFERLKREYQKLSDRNDKEKGQEQQIENIVKRQLQAQKEYHRQQLQGNKQQKRFQASPSFMKGLSQILGTKDRSQMRALMQKVRDDEREEREKVRGR